jgi:hypothetical protein
MAKGAYFTKHFDDTLKKGIYETQVPNVNFLYQTPTTTKNVEYDVGDKVVLPDGREFRYAKSLGNNALFAAHGVSFTYTGYVSYTAFAVSADSGATEITIPAASHGALTLDELRGGYVIIFDGATDLDTTVRGIVGNDAADDGAAFKVQLDGQIHNAIVAGTEAAEVYQNPWIGMEVASNVALPIAGVPTTTVSAAANYFWVQTKGITWVAPQTGVGDHGGMLTCWRHDGSLESAETAFNVTVPGTDRTQIAGYCIQGSKAGNGPLLMLADHG